MRAVVLRAHGGPEVLTIEDVDQPRPGPDDVLVAIRATALNRADILQRMGGYPDPRRGLSLEIPGLEFSGVVRAVGERVTMWKVGDRVMAIESGGAYAEFICTHERQLMAVPSTVSLADAAAIPEVFLTAWDALVLQGGLTSGRWALVHAGASGVGTAAIQIAKAIGARIAVTCSSGKIDACRALGADLVIERSPNDWLAEATAVVPAGFDVVLDVVGGDEVDRNLRAVASKGTIVQVGLMGGGTTNVNVGLLLAKRARWIGTTLRARPIEEKAAVTRRFAAEMLPLFESGQLKPIIDRRYPLERIAEATRPWVPTRTPARS
ncbi:MAG: NAD(P)H-quinone oxidoreductase [Ilumatobacteraceae bacterium]